jgi:hypothetical protein
MTITRNYFGSIRHRPLVSIAWDVAERIRQYAEAKAGYRRRYATIPLVLTICPRGLVRLEPEAEAAEVDIVGRYTMDGMTGLRVMRLAKMVEEDLEAHPHYIDLREAA